MTEAITVAALRPDDDLTRLGDWLADARIARGLNILPRRLTQAELRRYVASFDGTSGVIMAIRSGEVLIGIAPFEINRRHRSAQWSLVLGDRAYRGKEILQESCLRLFDWAYDVECFEKVSSRIAATKLHLVHFQEQMGIRREGYLRGEVLLADGSGRQDEILFGLLKADWPSVRANVVAALPHLGNSV
jgi:RimJ/RimL family protein N-acetyltransferase